MVTLRSYVQGEWYEADDGWADLINPCSEEAIARVSSSGLDFAKAVAFAREEGGANLRAMSFGGRGELLLAMSRALQAHRDELIGVSLENTGTTRKDAKFDIDGGIFTLSFYGQMGQAIGERKSIVDGEGLLLGRSARFWGQHLLVPLDGIAVHINAFNFPVWGFAEKAACTLLAGLPLLTKPATSSALVAARAVEILIDEAGLPPGSFSMICGSTGDLLDHLGAQDVLAFTGSASTALALRGRQNLLASSTRVNIEADSLNAAVLGPDADPSSETWAVFLRDVVREVTQKTGQKCTAVRRILVPHERVDAVQEELCARLSEVVVGNPEDGAVTMGPLATAQQLDDAVGGVGLLGKDAKRVLGSGARIDGAGNPEGKGYFLGPTLLAGSGRRCSRQRAPSRSLRSGRYAPALRRLGLPGCDGGRPGPGKSRHFRVQRRPRVPRRLPDLWRLDERTAVHRIAEGGRSTSRVRRGHAADAPRGPRTRGGRTGTRRTARPGPVPATRGNHGRPGLDRPADRPQGGLSSAPRNALRSQTWNSPDDSAPAATVPRISP